MISNELLIDKIQSKYDFYLRIFYGIATFASLLGIIIMSVFLNEGTPAGYYTPLVSSIWMAVLMCFHSLQGWLLVSEEKKTGKFTTFYLYCSTFLVLLLVFGYLVGFNYRAGGWAVAFFTVCLVNLFVFHARRESQLAYDIEITSQPKEEVAESKRSIYFWRGITAFRVIFLILLALLQGGCWLQMSGYRRFKPNGTFYTITLSTGQTQTILAQCVGPKNSSLPTFWMEVGGGGHSMSDLWGLRDYISQNYNRRYCSYDMPGTGWSSDAVSDQPIITERLIDAMGEPGPFIMMGTMDEGDVRAYQYALDHPDRVVAVVPIVMSQIGEFTWYGTYFGWSEDKTIQYAKSELSSRVTFANIINFFGVGWGLLPAIIPPDSNYRPQKYAYESAFLNSYNERQWITNANIVFEGFKNPKNGKYGVMGETIWLSNASLSKQIPVLAYDLYMTDQDIYDTCDGMMFSHSSSDCQFYFYQHNQTLLNYNTVIARNPLKSTLTLCKTCTVDGNNGFLIDKNQNIPWFVESLMQQVGNITV